MEEITTYRGEAMYVLPHGLVSVWERRSTTPLYGVIKIDNIRYQCMPSGEAPNCVGCAFYSEKHREISCADFPCERYKREDENDCIFVEVVEENFSKEISTTEFKKLETYRFKC